MLINLRNALMAGKRLPYNAEIAYLESTGTQWIDTLFFPTATTSVEIYCKILSTPNNYNPFFGCGTAYNGANVFCLAAALSNSRIFCYRGSKVNQVTANNAFSDGDEIFGKISPTQGGIHNYTKGQDFYVDLSSSAYTQGQNSLYLFNGNIPNTSDLRRGSNIQMYNARIFNGTTITHDFIPVRVGTVGYMYDRVSGKLFGNAGTGDFVLGQDVVPVEWIGTTGSQHVDTGIRATPDSVIQCTLTPISRTYNGMVFYGAGKADGEAGFGDIVELVDQYSNYGHIVFVATGRAANGIEFSYGNTLVTTANCSTGALTVNGTTAITANRLLTGTAQYPLYIGCANVAGTRFRGANCRYHSFAIEQSGILAGSFYPIRVGTEGAMMDTLTRRIYRNAGTGAFTYGNDLKYPIPAS